MIIRGISENNVIMNQPCLIFINNTDQCFLTSDRPVIHKIINWRQTSNLIGKDFLTNSYNNSIEKPFFYMPITSTLAFVSSAFIERTSELDERNGLIFINQLNIQMCLNAEEYVYAENRFPLLDQKSFLEYLNKCSRGKRINYAKVISESDIYYIDVYDSDKEDSKIIFKTRDTHFLNEVAEGNAIKLIEIYTENWQRGMRNAKILTLNKSSGEVVIESNFQLKQD